MMRPIMFWQKVIEKVLLARYVGRADFSEMIFRKTEMSFLYDTVHRSRHLEIVWYNESLAADNLVRGRHEEKGLPSHSCM